MTAHINVYAMSDASLVLRVGVTFCLNMKLRSVLNLFRCISLYVIASSRSPYLEELKSLGMQSSTVILGAVCSQIKVLTRLGE